VIDKGENEVIARTKPLVLVVDDDPAILELVRLRLGRFGCALTDMA
jgi:CheY-like chemotaxis protein